MKANKIVKVFDLTLNSPKAFINSVVYNWANDTAVIEVIFQEEGSIFKHSRSFSMNTNGEVITPLEIKEFIKTQLTDFE